MEMPNVNKLILFGVRLPLCTEHEETCHRLGLTLYAAVSVNGTPRLVSQSTVVPLSEFDASSIPGDIGFVVCAFSSARRETLCELALSHALVAYPALIDPSAVVARSVRVGNGSFIISGAIIGVASMIGRHCLINRSSSLGHHCILEDFVSIGPGATLASNIRVGKHAMIGVGAVVAPNVSIGDNAIIVAGSLIRRDVPSGVFMAGNPPVERQFNPQTTTLNVDNDE